MLVAFVARPDGRVALACARRAGLGAAGARAEACPGSGPRPCPYSAAAIVGSEPRACCASPRPSPSAPQGDVYVADQLSYVVQKFSPPAGLRDRVGLLRGRPRPVRPDRRPGDRPGRQRLRRRLQPQPDREVRPPTAPSSPPGAIRGSELGPVQLRLLAGLHPAARRGHRRGGRATSTSPTAATTASSASTSKAAKRWPGAPRAARPASSPTRAASPPTAREVLVSDDDNHRIEQFDPEGAFVGAASARNGTGPGQFGFPYGVALDAAGNVYVADDINHRIVKLSPQLAFAGAWGGFGTKPGQLAFPRALASDPAGRHLRRRHGQRPHRGLRPERQLPAHDRHLRPRPRSADRRRKDWPLDPTGRLLVSDTDRQPPRAVRARQPAVTPASGPPPPGRSPGLERPGRARRRSRRLGLSSADRGNERLVRFWGDGTYLWRNRRARRDRRRAAQRAPARSRSRPPARTSTYVADAGHNRILVYGPEGTAARPLGRRRRRRRRGQRARAPSTIPRRVAVDGAGDDLRGRHRQQPHRQALPRGQRDRPNGAPGAPPTGTSTPPTGIGLDGAGNVYVLDSENNRVQVFDPNGRFLFQLGQPRPGPRAVLPADRPRRRLRRQRLRRRHQQQPHPALRTRLPRRHRLPRPGRLAAAAGRRARAAA